MILPPKTYFEKVRLTILNNGLTLFYGWLVSYLSMFFSLMRIQAVVKKYDILFIADEVLDQLCVNNFLTA